MSLQATSIGYRQKIRKNKETKKNQYLKRERRFSGNDL